MKGVLVKLAQLHLFSVNEVGPMAVTFRYYHLCFLYISLDSIR